MGKESRRYEALAQELSAAIKDGIYAIGQRLPAERTLAQTHQVSRPTVREALLSLELDGLVEARQGSGVYVTARQPAAGSKREADTGPFELLEARRAIEGEVCALAAGRISEAELAELEALVEEMNVENERDITRAEDADRRFHQLIAEATGNVALVAAVQMLWDARERSPQTRFLTAKAHAAGIKPRIDEHRTVIAALREGQADGARAAMNGHLGRVMQSLFDATEVHELEQARSRVEAQRKRFVGG